MSTWKPMLKFSVQFKRSSLRAHSSALHTDSTRSVCACNTVVCLIDVVSLVYYDRILVLDAGQVAEFDTPLALYDKEDSVFRSLCSEASLNRQDIIRIRKAVQNDDIIEEV